MYKKIVAKLPQGLLPEEKYNFALMRAMDIRSNSGLSGLTKEQRAERNAQIFHDFLELQPIDKIAKKHGVGGNAVRQVVGRAFGFDYREMVKQIRRARINAGTEISPKKGKTKKVEVVVEKKARAPIPGKLAIPTEKGRLIVGQKLEEINGKIEKLKKISNEVDLAQKKHVEQLLASLEAKKKGMNTYLEGKLLETDIVELFK